jgi:hypothetical protein
MLAQDAFAAGDTAQGQSWLRQMTAQETLGTMGTLLFLAAPASVMVDGALQGGDWPAALEGVETTLAEAQARKLRLDQVRLWVERGRCLVGLRQPEQAERQFQVALETAEENGPKPLCWRLQGPLLALYHSRGQKERAAAHQTTARELVEESSESLIDAEQRRSFQATPAVRSIIAD